MRLENGACATRYRFGALNGTSTTLFARDEAIGGAGGQAIDAACPTRHLPHPSSRIGLPVVFGQRDALAFERHERHTPAAARLHALDVYQEDLAGAGQQCELRRQRGPARVLRQHRSSPAVDAQDQRRLLEVAEHNGDAAVGSQMRMRLVARAAEIEVANLARTEHAKAVEPFRRQVDPSVGCRGRHEENRLLADHLDMAVVQSFGEFGHWLSPSAGACRSRPTGGSARCGRRRSYQPIAVRRTLATKLCLYLKRLADVDQRASPDLAIVMPLVAPFPL